MTALHALNLAHAEQIAADGGGWVFAEGALPYGEACQPCETCGGWGKNIGTRYAPHPPRGDCPDCHDGRRRCELVVPCPRCWDDDWPQGASAPYEDCPSCDGMGTITVAHVVAVGEPLRVIGEDEPCVGSHVCVFRGDVRYVQHAGGVGNPKITLPPDIDPQTLVGQWALRVEVAR